MKKQKNKPVQKQANLKDAGPKEEPGALRKFLEWRKERKRKIEEQKKKKLTFSESLWSWTKTIVGAIIVVMIINGIAIASFVVPTGSMENTVMTGDFLFVNKFVYGPSTPQVIPFVDVPLPFYKFPGVSDPEKGDVIVFIYPGEYNKVEPDQFIYYLKRCVATAGDTVHVKYNQLYVNGEPVPMADDGKFVNKADTANPTRFPHGKDYSISNWGPERVPKEGDTLYIKNKMDFVLWDVFIQREDHKTDFRNNSLYVDDIKTDFYVVERNYCFGMGDNRNNSADSRMWGFIPYENVVGTPIMVYWSWQTRKHPKDDYEWSIWKKIENIRWSRIGTFID